MERSNLFGQVETTTVEITQYNSSFRESITPIGSVRATLLAHIGITDTAELAYPLLKSHYSRLNDQVSRCQERIVSHTVQINVVARVQTREDKPSVPSPFPSILLVQSR